MTAPNGSDRLVRLDCGCCPPCDCNLGGTPCASLVDIGPWSPIRVLVDIAGLTDNGCDCTNLNSTFPACRETGQHNHYLYADAFACVKVSWSPGDANWKCTLQNQCAGSCYTLVYTCPCTTWAGCGSATFTYDAGLSTNPSKCSNIPATIVVRTDVADPCNCTCACWAYGEVPASMNVSLRDSPYGDHDFTISNTACEPYIWRASPDPITGIGDFVAQCCMNAFSAGNIAFGASWSNDCSCNWTQVLSGGLGTLTITC